MLMKLWLVVITLPLLFVACTPIPPLKYTVTLIDIEERSSGLPDDIPLENCGGTRDSEQTQTVSRNFSAEWSVKISANIATEFGGNVGVAEAKVKGEIGKEVGVTSGTEIAASSSLKIITPPRTKTITTVQWKEKWTLGTIRIERLDGTVLDELEFTAFSSVVLEQQGVTTIRCSDGAIVSQQSVGEQLPVTIDVLESTPTLLPSDTPALDATPTDTLIPTVVLTDAPAPTSTPTLRPSDTPTATHTQLPTPTQTSLPTATSTETPVPPTSTSIPPTNTPAPVKCEGSGDLSLLPLAPPNGCVLIVEWYISANEQCGILFTQNEPGIAAQAIGTWWYVYPNRLDSHLGEYRQKYPHCEVQDLR